MSETSEDKPAAKSAPAHPAQTGRVLAWVNYFRTRIRELAIVFFGVYAAFLLNRFDAERGQTKRRGQILEALEREVAANVDELRQAVAAGQSEIAVFDRRLAAGEMPDLGISYNSYSYSPSDDATFLQAGGLDVLDVETLDQLRKVNSLRRAFVASMQNQYHLELTILGPHESGGFYDENTKGLKKHFAWYPGVLHQVITDGRTLLAGEEEFLRLLQTKRRTQ